MAHDHDHAEPAGAFRCALITVAALNLDTAQAILSAARRETNHDPAPWP